MDLYTFSLALGGVGLGVMAVGGLSHQSHGGQHGHHGHHGGHGVTHHGGHHVGHHGADGHGAHHGAHHSAPPAFGHHAAASAAGLPATLLWTLGAPRLAFSVLLGFGAAGVLLRSMLGGPVLFAVALVAGIALERLVLHPLTNLLFGFASTPAQTLDSTVLDEARATSGFDANGEGLVAIQLDGQVVQVLGTLRSEDRALGLRVRAGDRLRIEDVDGERHRCTVSFVSRP